MIIDDVAVYVGWCLLSLCAGWAGGMWHRWYQKLAESMTSA